jgi:hypothetical protein
VLDWADRAVLVASSGGCRRGYGATAWSPPARSCLLDGDVAAPDQRLGIKLTSEREAQSLVKQQLVRDYATGLLDRDEFAQAKAKAEAQAAPDALDAQIAELGRSSHVAGLVSPGQTVRDAWMANGLD